MVEEGYFLVDREKIMARVNEQAEKKRDTESIRAWVGRLSRDGIPARGIDSAEAVRRKPEVLDLVQRKAEDCTYLGRI